MTESQGNSTSFRHITTTPSDRTRSPMISSLNEDNGEGLSRLHFLIFSAAIALYLSIPLWST